MSNDTLMLLFQAGLFLLAILTFVVLLIDKMSKKNSSPWSNWLATIFYKNPNDTSCLSN